LDKFNRRHKTFSTKVLDWIMERKGLVASDPLEILIAQEEEEQLNQTLEIKQQLYQERIMALKRYINKLPKDDRFIMQSYFFKGKTLAEIADELGYKTPSAVWKRKKKILARMKQEIL